MPKPHLAQQRSRGLTLIELLVALALLSMLALLSWRTLDGIVRSKNIALVHSAHWHDWEIALAQWDTDLAALSDTGQVSSVDFDGQVLRLTRQAAAPAPGWQVVAWSIQSGSDAPSRHWSRWVSPPLQDLMGLQQAWSQAELWGHGSINQAAIDLLPVQAWQLFYHRDGAWSHPQSAAGNTNQPAPTPDGIRLELTLPNGTRLRRDWVHPSVGGER